jgi:hypothetical protein
VGDGCVLLNRWFHAAAQFVKPYVKTNNNDAADAEAICEAVARPNMRCLATRGASMRDNSAGYLLPVCARVFRLGRCFEMLRIAAGAPCMKRVIVASMIPSRSSGTGMSYTQRRTAR